MKDERIAQHIHKSHERPRNGDVQSADPFITQGETHCSECNRPVSQGLKALGKTVHKEHFRCSFCQRSLFDGRFWEKDEVPCCEGCAMLNTDVCTSCSQKIGDEMYTAAMAKAWHVNCFRCVRSGCHVVLDSKFYIIDGLPYCPNCVQKKVDSHMQGT